jgi:CBS domain-containing protein/sporulation protein YlmC with PRC-barrel domain
MEIDNGRHLPDGTYFLSDVLNEKVFLKGKKIGKISDLVILDKDKVAEVTHLVISRPFGYPSLKVPWEMVRAFDGKEITIDVDDVEKFAVKIPEGVVLLKDFILDKKILDMEDTEVEVVYDIKMVLKKNKLFVTDVDPSSYARLRRMGLDFFERSTSPFANLIKKGHDKSEDTLIPWSYVQALPSDIDGFKGNVKLKILKEKLNDLPPVDLVEILEDLDHEQRVMVINQLDADQASDALEEIGPNMQREIISSLKKEKVAGLIDMMTPGQAADVLSVLTFEDQNAIMKLMDDENIDKIKSILEKQQENIQNITTEKYLKVFPEETVKSAQNGYPKLAKDKDEIMYLYVVDKEDKLLGVIDVKELLKADDKAFLQDIMVKNVISLKKESTLGEAETMFSRYDFRALPITDEEDRMAGVVRYRDVTKLTHHFLE